MGRVRLFSLLTLLLCVALALPACSDDDTGGSDATITDGSSDMATADGNSSNIVVVTDDITETTTWKKGFIYLIEAYNMYVEASLTIEEGVIVKFHSDKGPEMLLGTGGTIIAKGTAADPIIFTSYKDDTQGGDTNNDEAATSPAAADWSYIHLNGHNGSVFEHCQFYYGGSSSSFSTLSLKAGAVATVKNCLFVHNTGGKSGCCYYGVLDGSGAAAGTVIEGNTFYDNDLPLSIDTTYDLDDSNTFHNPDETTQTNKHNGVFLNATGEITTALSWGETEVPFVVNDNDLWIDVGASLTLADDVVIKFTADSALLYDGTNLVNHDGTDVAFTSYKDDARKGDTNGDADTTTPADGDWNGIYNNADAVSDYESWANIHYDNH